MVHLVSGKGILLSLSTLLLRRNDSKFGQEGKKKIWSVGLSTGIRPVGAKDGSSATVSPVRTRKVLEGDIINFYIESQYESSYYFPTYLLTGFKSFKIRTLSLNPFFFTKDVKYPVFCVPVGFLPRVLFSITIPQAPP